MIKYVWYAEKKSTILGVRVLKDGDMAEKYNVIKKI